MTTRAENKIIREIFELHGISQPAYYNDAWTRTRRRVFKTNIQESAKIGNILDMLEDRGIRGWERFDSSTYYGERWKRTGIKKVTNLK